MTPIRQKKYGDDWAMFMPSVSQMFVLAHAKGWAREPIDFDLLNFFDEKNTNHCFHPYGLYSAGHAFLDPAGSDRREPMIQGRNRNETILVGDSGGFQAATGVLDFDWADPMGAKACDQRIKLIKWLEHTADYSMVLDWPAWAINTGRLPQTLMICDPTTDPLKITHDPFDNCLKGTIWNNEFFIKHRTPGATQFLNVLQGRSVEEAYEWYDAVTPFSDKKKYGDRAFEGWAFGGSTGGDPSVTMRLLIKLRDDGHLDGDDRWLHVLGRSRLTSAVYLTALNQALKKHVNPGCQISYDASSAFLYSVNGRYITDAAINPEQLFLYSADFPMNASQVGSKDPFIYAGVSEQRLASPDHYKSKVSKLLTMGDLVLAPDEKSKKGYRMDTASYYYLMAHNMELQLNAIETACSKLSLPDVHNHLPPNMVEFQQFINHLFTTENPFSLLDKEGDRYSTLIGGERPGVSALENTTMFPRTTGHADIEESIKARKLKVPKVAKVQTKNMLSDLLQ